MHSTVKSMGMENSTPYPYHPRRFGKSKLSKLHQDVLLAACKHNDRAFEPILPESLESLHWRAARANCAGATKTISSSTHTGPRLHFGWMQRRRSRAPRGVAKKQKTQILSKNFIGRALLQMRPLGLQESWFFISKADLN